MAPLKELEGAFQVAMHDKNFRSRLDYYLRDYAGRPTPLYLAESLSHGRCPSQSEVPYLYGGKGYPPAGYECLSHEAPRSRGYSS